MDKEDITVTVFNLDERQIYVKIKWLKTKTTVFQIKIFDDSNTWSGSFSTESAEECRKDVVESEEDYYRNVKNCLSCSSDMFVYDFNTIGRTGTFKWKKHFEGISAKLVHGYVKLEKDVITESKNVLINYLLKENMVQKKEIEKYDKIIKQMKSEIDELKAELLNFAEIKISLEDCLYGKFVSILNTKKARIEFLEEQLKKYEKT